MPTATATTVAKNSFVPQLPLKVSTHSIHPVAASSSTSMQASPTAQTSTSATLRSLYNRAGRAFVLRDIPLTYSLIQAAFALLSPPRAVPDPLGDHRRKWDILRITFESTVYASPPPSTETLPESLRVILSESAQALSMSIYTRSLSLFTPSNANSAPKATLNAAYLPSQVLTTLVYSSIKLDAADVGRVMIEDWLARREPQYSLEEEGYAKILDLYCIHILPRLEQWDYATEFLEYENELPERKREHLKNSLGNLYTQAMTTSHRPQQSAETLSASVSSPRPYSPAPSSSSSSSSLSTTSTHTVVPGNRSSHSPPTLSSLSHIVPSPTSVSSDETSTPRATHATLAPATTTSRSRSKPRTVSSSASSAYSSLPRAQLAHQVSATHANPPGIYALIRGALTPYLTRPKLVTFFLLFVLVPLVSLALRIRRRRRQALGMSNLGMGITAATAAAAVSASNADLVRRRLQVAGSESGIVRKAWEEMVRVVGDTVRMAGSGLV